MGMRVKAARSLEALPIRPSRFTQALVADSYSANITDWASADHLLRTSRPVKNAMFSYVYPEKSPDPKVLAVSDSALAALDLDPNVCETDEFAQVFSGNKILDDTRPWALCYGGHQFGLFAGQLGDGRAVSLFETQNEKGERYEVQLKGAGRTPYSRFGDGYAVLRSSIREFLASEYMHALGIPTTRALTLIGTSREVYRDDAPANVRQPERGAIVTRMAPSWLRFGNFELFYSRDEMSNIRKLADYAIEHVIPPENQQDEKGTGNKYAQFIRRVGKRTAQMAAEWQAVGFNHGVMNTDNMSILGLTLDYGPFQFFDFYDPEYICNHSDTAGQYAFKRQPTVCIFNMFKLGVPLFELIGANDKVDSLVYPGEGPEDEVTDEATRKAYREAGKELVTQMLSQEFSDWFMEHLLFKMRRKLGLVKEPDGPEDMNDLIIPLLDWMTEYHVDNHRFFRSLANYKVTENGEEADAEDAQLDIVCRDAEVLSESKEALKPWLAMYRHRLLQDGPLDNAERKKRMDQVNPRFILRNWIAQEVVDAFDSENQEEQAIDILKACLEACTDPYRNKYEDERIEKWINSPVPEWGRNLQCSCSS